MKARTFIVTSLVLLAAAPLYAQDPPKEAGKAETPPAVGTAPPKPPAEKAERVMDPKAMKLIDAYRAAIHTPASAGLKSFSAKGELAAGMGPDPITLNPTWNAKDGLTVAIGIPDSLAEMIPPEMMDMVKGQVKDLLVDKLVRPLFDGLLTDAADYNIALLDAKAGSGVKLTSFAANAAWERLEVHFDAAGLVSNTVGVLHVDPADPVAGTYAGVEIEFKTTHKKRGERSTIESVDVTTPLGELHADATYYDGPAGFPLLHEVTTSDPMGGPARTLKLFDYTVDDKAVAGTEKPAKATAKPADKPTVTPSEGSTEKPTEKPPEPAK